MSRSRHRRSRDHESPRSSARRRTVALGTAGIGVVGLSVGLALALHSGSTPAAAKRAATSGVTDAAVREPLAALAAKPVLHGLLAGTTVRGGSRWYAWTADATGTATLASAAAGVVPSVSVYMPGSAGHLVPLVAPPSGDSARTFVALAGHRYLFAVGATPAPAGFRFVLLQPHPTLIPAAAPRSTPNLVATPGPTVSCASAPTAWSRGPVSIACTAASTVGLMNPKDANFDLVASISTGTETPDGATATETVCDTAGDCSTAGPIAGIELDDQPPDVTCNPTPTGWTATDVTVHCVASDDGVGLADTSQAAMTFSTAVPSGTSAQVTLPAVKVCDTLGNCTTAGAFGPIKVDRTTPSSSCPPAPTGWSGSEVSIVCHVSDVGSGLADSSDATVTLQTAVPTDSYDANASTNSTQVCSAVGTCITLGPVTGLKVDLAPPAVSCLPTSGWSFKSVTVHCSASAPSGLANPAQSAFTLTASVPPGAASANATTNSVPVCDTLGRCATAGPVGEIKIDESPPSISCGSAPSTWSSQSVVSIHCSAYDTYSGLVDPASASFTLTASVPSGGFAASASTNTVHVCAKSGVCTTAGPVTGIHIDTTRPTVTCGSPPSGALTMNVMVHCTASDTASGLADPADASFYLTTNVAAGTSDVAAATDSRNVCSAAGECVTAGPVAADIDRAVTPKGAPPAIKVPRQATVVVAATSTLSDAGAAYPIPGSRDALGEPLPTVCSPGPAAPLEPGWTTVTCDAADGAGRQTVAAFPLAVIVDPQMASSGTATAGKGWRAVGTGYAPDAPVVVSFDSVVVANAIASGTGVASVVFPVPENAGIGVHTLTLSGSDHTGDPLTFVVSLRTKPAPNVIKNGAAAPIAGSNALAAGAPASLPDDTTLPTLQGTPPKVPAPIHVLVAAPTPTPTPSSSSGGLIWLWIGLAVLLLAVSGGVVARRRHRGSLATDGSENAPDVGTPPSEDR